MARILVIEDDPRMGRVLGRLLAADRHVKLDLPPTPLQPPALKKAQRVR